VVGILMWNGGVTWFGHLAGDTRIERESVQIDSAGSAPV